MNQLRGPVLGALQPRKDLRHERNEARAVTVEKRSGSSEVDATVTEIGKSGSATGGTVEEALNRAKDKAKG